MKDVDVFKRLLAIVEKYRRESHAGTFLEYRDPAELAALLDLERGEGREDWQMLFEWVEKYLRYAVKTDHPDFVNRMWSGASLPSIVGEIVAAVSNTSACTYETAPVSTLLETYMIERMLHIVGFVGGQGQMTTGSSNANMVAMMCARNLHDPAVRTEGVGRGALAAFVSADAHYSMDRAANILGIGLSQLIKVPVDDHGRMDMEKLEGRLEEAVGAGRRPFFVAATAGTTVRGAFDPIEPLLALRSRYGFWLHVDGAWGGVAVLGEQLRRRYLRGLELADSFTMDFHKMLGLSLICNVLLLNRQDNLFRQALSAGDGSYLFRDDDGEGALDFGPSSLQCGRRVDSLKWFLDWKFHGQAGLAARVERFLDLCRHAEKCVEQHGELELMAPRESFNLCFRYRWPETEANRFNLALRTRLYRQGISMVGCAYIDGRLVLRLLVTNVAWTVADVERYFESLIAAGRQLAAEWPAAS
ncbi:MAG: PLP-dependent decarboxylase [Desulfobulbaceae bacterium]|nr:MAG: PLP-dependent decarboxylase [Desulfobulbaceae bacterium]